MTGLTAYFGLLDVAKVKEGDTVVVSGAAGAVGSVAGQIAKIKGARAIGIAGGEEKCRWLVDELGFDAAIDYKSEDVRRALREHAPKGVDVYFDNVGGEILDAVLTRLARGARIVICGAVSQYNATEAVQGPVQLPLAARVPRVDDRHGRVRLRRPLRRGDRGDRRLDARRPHRLARAHRRRRRRRFPEALLKLFAGENTGKLVLRVGALSSQPATPRRRASSSRRDAARRQQRPQARRAATSRSSRALEEHEFADQRAEQHVGQIADVAVVAAVVAAAP